MGSIQFGTLHQVSSFPLRVASLEPHINGYKNGYIFITTKKTKRIARYNLHILYLFKLLGGLDTHAMLRHTCIRFSIQQIWHNSLSKGQFHPHLELWRANP